MTLIIYSETILVREEPFCILLLVLRLLRAKSTKFFPPNFADIFSKSFSPNSIKNCVFMLSTQVTGSLAPLQRRDVMNVRSSSVNTQSGVACLVFPRLICRSARAGGFI